MFQRLMLAAVFMLCLAVPGQALATTLSSVTVTLTGEFENMLSRGCYPIRMEVSAVPQARTFILSTFGVTFYPRGVNCGRDNIGNRIDGVIPPGETLLIEVDMQRDLGRDTRVLVGVTANTFVDPCCGDGVNAIVTFADPAPLIVARPLIFESPNALDRDQCYFISSTVYPENIPVTLNFTPSVTNGVPDLEIHGNGCHTPAMTSVELPGARDPNGQHLTVSFRRAPANTGATGTLTVSSPTLIDGVPFAPSVQTFTFQPVPPVPAVWLSGEFEHLMSRGCYPIRLDITAKPEARTFALDGAGVTFYPADVQCDGATIGHMIDGVIPAGEPLSLELNMQRDLKNDTRVAATVSAAAFTAPGVVDAAAEKRVSFVDSAPLIVVVPLFRDGNTNLDRNGCHFITGKIFPEDHAIFVDVRSSATTGVPDLEIHGNGCDSTPILTGLNLSGGRDPDDFHFIASVKRAPGNAGRTGTLTFSSSTVIDAVGTTFTPVVQTFTFKPRATLSVTAPVTTNLPPDSCVKATVKVGTFDFPSIRVRVYSGSGNARVYSSAGCATTINDFTLPPNGSRDVWLKPVAPDVPQTSLVANTGNVPNVEPTSPAAAGLSFYFAQ